ncbi:MAG: response regulator transcription factor [Lentimicrobium sp.]|jgi:DNA-binding NarL/FixJ family response regulator|nr:response regulator transcription factor [Lentimicrobium sp.]MDD2526895.1 response regulator transcription factor [Lentimicrobiaceae bacterium]MDD4598304.1 response regulator transcription factor [Lentimicrobiaceae bacterium]MDY0026135.1 response regulator transcription factor [Lentimicrobium sp.]HAH59173.1 DNA-binding response regulator [Bacteroidales bacterium]
MIKTINIYLVDDHKLFREGLKLLLSGLDYVGDIYEASDGSEFLMNVAAYQPDLVFMDISMPGTGGIEATSKALAHNPNLKIIALSMFSDENYYTKMIGAGAVGFILKNSGIQEVEQCMQAVLSGHNYFSPEIMSGILHNITRKPRQQYDGTLSEREEEVLYSICQGLSNIEISEKLCISKRTVDKHRENLLLKTNSKNTAGLVMFAIRNGIMEV